MKTILDLQRATQSYSQTETFSAGRRAYLRLIIVLFIAVNNVSDIYTRVTMRNANRGYCMLLVLLVHLFNPHLECKFYMKNLQ